MDASDLHNRYKFIKEVHDESFIPLYVIWRRLPQSQWEVTFAQKMTDLPEYKDLRKALTAFKNKFLGKDRHGNAR